MYLLGSYTTPSVVLGATTLTNPSGAANLELFLAKYTPWAVAWAMNIGDTSVEVGAFGGIARGTDVYICSYYNCRTFTLGSYTFHNADASGYTHDLFLAKYNTDGRLLWATSQEGSPG
jgi:hypothetical protein